mmetsp:Transcript_3972/g.8101  ORF Transcript_3972/g.8101 Transcript_3972/m.8101 type:complete len:637 (+) Transcript_3972:989-2899(+)
MPSAAPSFSTEAVEVLQALTEASPLSEEALEDPDSPQYKAYLWLIGPAGQAKENPSRTLQRFALATLFYSTGGDEGFWTRSDGWLTAADECTWFRQPPSENSLGGIAFEELCDNSFNVRALLLRQNGLRGRIPPEIGLLESMRELDLSENSLTGTIPRLELMRVTFLNLLDLSSNSLEGALPIPTSEDYFGELQSQSYNSLFELRLNDNNLNATLTDYHIASLSSLSWLDLSRNSINGEWPIDGMDQLSSLQELSLAELFFSGSIDDTIWAAWKNLESLNLQNSGLGGTIPDFIDEFSNLRTLDISYSSRRRKGNPNDFFGTIPESFATLDNLRGFWFQANRINGSFPEFLMDLTNLQFLIGTDNELSSTIPPSIANMTSLKNFEFQGNSLSGRLPTEIGLLSDGELREFKVGRNQLTGPFPTELGRLTSLARIFIQDNAFTGPIPTQIGEMESLTSFVIHTNDFNSTFPTQIGKLVGLSMIQLMLLNGITGTLPTEIGLLTKMSRFRITDTSMTGTLPSEIGNLINVEEFKLERTHIGGPLPSTIATMESLTEFSVFNNTFNETIPAGLASLSFITEASFGMNSFTGPMPFCEGSGTALNPLVADCSELVDNCTCCTVCCKDGEECNAPLVAGSY